MFSCWFELIALAINNIIIFAYISLSTIISQGMHAFTEMLLRNAALSQVLGITSTKKNRDHLLKDLPALPAGLWVGI